MEASLLAAHVLQRPRSWILAHPEAKLSAEQIAELGRLLDRLAQGEPLAYLTGSREFYGLDFFVTPDVLVPRPETELLVEQALIWLQAHPGRRRAVDVGAGTGCIAVTLAKLTPDLCVTAVDRSPAALQIARRNALRHAVSGRMDFVQSDLLSALPGPFDLVCANLPYIPTADVDILPVGRFEPRLALDGGSDGLDLIRRLLSQISSRLAPTGLALFEIEYRQGQVVSALAQAAFPQGNVSLIPDLAGLDRLVQIRA